MKRAGYFFILAAISICFTSCLGTGNQVREKKPQDVRALVNRACFEVVVKKPVKDSLKYESELPWDLIDFSVRNDKFFPVGTAFAISENELLSACHVLQFMDDSANYAEYYIRDSAGEVFEIDQIVAFHSARDFVKFTVKGKKFQTWLKMRNAFELNESLFAVGNIYGQGIVAVPGTLLGTLPEQENGRWKFIKSSPPNDKGSSGGPLLDAKGDVIGIIVAKDDNFCYSLPVSEMKSIKENTGLYHRKFYYRFILFPEKTDAVPFDHEVALPAHYRDVKKQLHKSFNIHYQKNMARLFEDNKNNIFPNGESSLMALNDACNDIDLQVFYKDENDMKWYISDLEKETSALTDNGTIKYSKVGPTFFIDLDKPNSVSLNGLLTRPELAMDLILRGINIPRKFAGQEIRIVSFGKPYEKEEFVDSYGRKWQINLWQLEYSDQVGILISSPTPDGLVCMLQFVRYSQRDVWLLDLKKTADFIYIPYFGTLKQWAEYLEQRDFLYGSLLDTELTYKKDDSLLMSIEDVKIDIGDMPLNVNDRSELYVSFDFYPNSHKTIWGLRKVVYSEPQKDNYFMLYRYLKPHAKLPDSYIDEWENVVYKRHPFNGIPYSKEGRTNIGFLHPKYTSQSGDELNNSRYIFAVYFAREGNVKESEIEANSKVLKKGIQIN